MKSNRQRPLPADALEPTEIIIRGSIFPHRDKEPYVQAGHSVLGALEYNAAADRIKCHACGMWVRSLGMHAARADGVTQDIYRRDYGLNATTSLCTPATRARLTPSPERVARFVAAGEPGRLRARANPFGRKTKIVPRPVAEDRNLKGLCRAQIPARIIQLALDLGFTPSAPQLKDAGLSYQVIRETFDMPVGKFMESLGLIPNPSKGGSLGWGRAGKERSQFQHLPTAFIRKHRKEVAAGFTWQSGLCSAPSPQPPQ